MKKNQMQRKPETRRQVRAVSGQIPGFKNGDKILLIKLFSFPGKKTGKKNGLVGKYKLWGTPKIGLEMKAQIEDGENKKIIPITKRIVSTLNFEPFRHYVLVETQDEFFFIKKYTKRAQKKAKDRVKENYKNRQMSFAMQR